MRISIVLLLCLFACPLGCGGDVNSHWDESRGRDVGTSGNPGRDTGITSPRGEEHRELERKAGRAGYNGENGR